MPCTPTHVREPDLQRLNVAASTKDNDTNPPTPTASGLLGPIISGAANDDRDDEYDGIKVPVETLESSLANEIGLIGAGEHIHAANSMAIGAINFVLSQLAKMKCSCEQRHDMGQDYVQKLAKIQSAIEETAHAL